MSWREWLGSRTFGQTVLLGIALALAIEAITCVLRFGFGLEAENETRWIARYLFQYRIHHGYFGALMLLATPALPRGGAWRNLVIVVGTGLLTSDILHHLAVLWPITGSPEFHIRYQMGILRM